MRSKQQVIASLEKLVEALKSGKYKQGKSVLRDSEDKFCCLGVWCEIEGMPKVKEDTRYTYSYGGEHNGWGLPSTFKNEMGLTNDLVYSGIDNNTLASLNDNGKSFEEISEVINEIIGHLKKCEYSDLKKTFTQAAIEKFKKEDGSNGMKLVECPLCAQHGMNNQTDFIHNNKDELICKKCSTPLDISQYKTSPSWVVNLIIAILICGIIYLVIS